VRHRREENQDGFFRIACDGPLKGDRLSLLCVLDGVSNANGKEAARTAAAVLRQELLRTLVADSAMLTALEDANRQDAVFYRLEQAVLTAAQTLFDLPRKCCTTVSIAAVLEDEIFAVNVGDSPVYLLKTAADTPCLLPLFECHNAAGLAVREGQMTAEEALTSPDRDKLMRSLGDIPPTAKDISRFHACLGRSDLLILGSDGALSVLPEEETAQIFARVPETGLEQAVRTLYDRVCESKSEDNFTLIAEWFEHQ